MSKLGTYTTSETFDGVTITFETGKLAQQASGAVVAHVGGSSLLVTTTASSETKEHFDFFPLTVDFEERMYAAGRIPGSFFKREGKASENAVLTCRLVDRPMRPTFPDGLRNEIQIVMTSLAADQHNQLDVLAINAASVATMLAGVPFDGPVAGVRLGMDREGNWRAFPTFKWMEENGVFDLVVAGRYNAKTKEVDVLMVEAEATPQSAGMIAMGAVKPTEDELASALEIAKDYLNDLCDFQLDFLEDAKPAQRTMDLPVFTNYAESIYKEVHKAAFKPLQTIYANESLSKLERANEVSAVKEKAIDAAFDKATVDSDISDEEFERQCKNAFKEIEKSVIRKRVVKDGIRVDGRKPTDIRPLSAEVGVLPRAHGSGLFSRGETQVLNVATLGMLRDAQKMDTIDPETERRYLHHYNFPQYSVGETGFMRGPKRREIGHGALAERALLPVIPQNNDFAYTLRLVSEVLSSNGSTSMASVCASTLSLMDAGVPIIAPVAGIAMGLINEGKDYVTLTDIQGVEDAFGDMDFKVAGTAEYVTALQLDTKLSGIPAKVLGDALKQAHDARLEILDVIIGAIEKPREELSAFAPRVHVEEIPQNKIGDVIGPKGKIIREISEETGASIDIDEEGGKGIVRIYAIDSASADAALERVRQIANPVVPKMGERYLGTVVNTVDFGAFVSIMPGVDGLLHVSNLGGGKRLNHANEAVDVGEKLWVEVSEVKPNGKYSLALVREDEAGEEPKERAPREERAPRTPRTPRESSSDERPTRRPRTTSTSDTDSEEEAAPAPRRRTRDSEEAPTRRRTRNEEETPVVRRRRRRVAE